jgi:hypothetical protein
MFLDWARNLTSRAVLDSAELLRQPSPQFWGAEIVYQVQVDRFFNGNVSNDGFNLPPLQTQFQNTPNLYGLPEYRMGGDIAGITARKLSMLFADSLLYVVSRLGLSC